MSDSVTKEMSIGEIVAKYPETASTFMEWGLHCYGCAVARYETLEQGAAAHGISVDDFVVALNKVVEAKE